MKILIIFAMVFIFTSCEKKYIYKNYAFNPIVQNYGWGYLRGSLKGNESNINKYTRKRKNPYTLIISVNSKDNLEKVLFKNLQLLNNKKVLFYKNLIKKDAVYSETRNMYSFALFFENITTEYKELSLSLEFQLENDEKIYKINRKFEKSYHEEYNTAIGILMQN